jgi:hypothetical protein
VVVYEYDDRPWGVNDGDRTIRDDAASPLKTGVLAREEEELFERLSDLNLNFDVPLLAIHDLSLDALFSPARRLHHRVSHEVIVRPRAG